MNLPKKDKYGLSRLYRNRNEVKNREKLLQNMNLPKKDKYGLSRLSYSQISLFKRDKKEYYDTYIVGKPR
jgi:hypothetical protein